MTTDERTLGTRAEVPPTTLSAALPHASLLITARVDALGPAQGDTSRAAHVRVHGVIRAPVAGTGAQPFVAVKLAPAIAGPSGR